MWNKLRDDPERALIGAIDPWSTKAWNKVLGKDYEPIVDQMGGAYGGSTFTMGDTGQGVYGRAKDAGVPTKAGSQMHDVAHVISGAMAGNYGYGKAGTMASNGGPQWMQNLMSRLQPQQGAAAQGGGSLLGGTGGFAGGGTYPPWATPPIMPQAQGAPAQSPPPMPPPPPPPQQRFAGPQWLQKAAGGLDRMMGTMSGYRPNPNLSAQENAEMEAQQRMAFATAMMQASAPRPQGTASPMADFGSAMQAGQQAGQQYSADAIRTKLMQQQLEQKSAERADPAAIREMQALGYPMTQEGFAQYNKDRGSQNAVGDQLAAIQAQLGIQQRQDQIERDRRADAAETEAQAQKRNALGNTLRRGVKQTGELAALTEKLEGSFLAAGMPASSWRRTGMGVLAGAGGALGMDTSKIEADLTNFDKLKKGLSDQLINLMATGELGEATNSKLEQYQNALATTETSPGAVMSIQAGIAEAYLEAADAQGIEIPDREKVEANIERWRSYESSADATAPPLDALLDKYAPVK
jgi:hypothetical protein